MTSSSVTVTLSQVSWSMSETCWLGTRMRMAADGAWAAPGNDRRLHGAAYRWLTPAESSQMGR